MAYMTSLSSEIQSFISQMDLSNSAKVSSTFDMISMMLDTNATEHEILIAMGVNTRLTPSTVLDVSEIQIMAEIEAVLANPTHFEKIENPTVSYILSCILLVRSKNFNIYSQFCDEPSPTFESMVERLCLYDPLLKQSRLYETFHDCLKSKLNHTLIEPELFKSEKIVYEVQVSEHSDELEKALKITYLLSIEVSEKDGRHYFSECIRYEWMLKRLMALLQAHFPTLRFSRSNRSYLTLEWTRKGSHFKPELYIRAAVRQALNEDNILDPLVKYRLVTKN